MNTTVLKLSESDAFLRNISIRTIKDVRALDVDLLLILVNGDRIVISSGAMQALNAPDMTLQFSDGQLPLARVFEQIERINVSPEATASDSGRSTTLTVDLDGVRGGLSYTLQLQNVAFNAANTQTIFGV